MPLKMLLKMSSKMQERHRQNSPHAAQPPDVPSAVPAFPDRQHREPDRSA
jgi:hypothetical protein